MDGSMQETNRDGAVAEPEQSVCKTGGTIRDFAEVLLPANEEMLEKELSELDELGLVSSKANPNPTKVTCSLEAHSFIAALLFTLTACMKGF